jgi:hypothetical protein
LAILAKAQIGLNRGLLQIVLTHPQRIDTIELRSQVIHELIELKGELIAVMMDDLELAFHILSVVGIMSAN